MVSLSNACLLQCQPVGPKGSGEEEPFSALVSGDPTYLSKFGLTPEYCGKRPPEQSEL